MTLESPAHAGLSFWAHHEDGLFITRKTAENIEWVVSDKPVAVFATEFDSSSVDFRVRWWSQPKPRSLHESRNRVIGRVKRAFAGADIEIPYPCCTLTSQETLRIAREAG